ncbi:MAG: zeta toxin family protein [Bradyrhizobiaceae bacterium]|nr:zeta toxin family protein [Bradyrhizobiaceae bacterium]
MTRHVERPKLIIVAGPNGSGKSTLFQDTIVQALGRTVWIINPDLLAARIRTAESLGPRAANLEAVRRIEKWLLASIDAHQTIGVETVLSTPKYRKLVHAAKQKQFEVVLVYVMLNSGCLNIARVKLRVQKGGHDVPVQKILHRRVRSLAQLPWFLEQADTAWLYDNSGAKPRLMGAKEGTTLRLEPDALPEIVDVIGRLRKESERLKK